MKQAFKRIFCFSVILLFCLPAARAADKVKVDEAIRRGVEYLIRTQQMDGTWRSYDPVNNRGQTALCGLALSKAGLDKNHPALKKAVNYLQYDAPTRTYDVAVIIMFLQSLDPEAHKDWIEALAEMLVQTQMSKLWAYPTGTVDMSNTQYAALGLHAAVKAGFKTSRKIWKDLMAGSIGYQSDDGGWGYRKSSDPTGAMTCAGLTCLYVCLKEMNGDDPKKKMPPGLRASLEEGLTWLDLHFEVAKNPKPYAKKDGACRWTYYYLYGVERVGTLSNRVKFGIKNWYDMGSEWLIKKQGDKGNWSSAYGESDMNTSFALLFLSRATLAKGSITVGSSSSRIVADDKGGGLAEEDKDKSDGKDKDDKEKKHIVMGCNRGNPGFLWIDSWSQEVADRFGILGGRRAIRVEKVEYLAGDISLGVVPGVENPEAKITRYPFQYTFEKNGDYELYAKVSCVSPNGTKKETYESKKVKVFIHNVLSGEDEAHMVDVAENIVKKGRPRVAASSTRGSNGGNRAVDGLHGTGWLSKEAEHDAEPWIRIEFDKPLMANQLKLAHFQNDLFDKEKHGRATRIQVKINRGSQKCEVTLDPDVTRKQEIPLRKIRVKELEIRVLEFEKGKRDSSLGFNEIEIFYRR